MLLNFNVFEFTYDKMHPSRFLDSHDIVETIYTVNEYSNMPNSTFIEPSEEIGWVKARSSI